MHRDVLTPKGATFAASRARADMEFLASQDSWFRPVNFYIGPDGALYVIDYYRPYIEHPEWASSDLQKSPEVLSTGKDRGRIYRVVATTGPAATRTTMRPKLGSATDAQLVEALGSSNIWWRRTAQRLLVHGKRRDAAPALVALASGASVGARSPACALDARGPRSPGRPAGAAGPEGPRPRRARERDRPVGALAVAAAVASALLAMTGDDNARVRFQLLATLGSIDTPASQAAQEQLLLAGIEDEWVQVAALSASSDRAIAYFDACAAAGIRPGRAGVRRGAPSSSIASAACSQPGRSRTNCHGRSAP